jgi:hypothetical protein
MIPFLITLPVVMLVVLQIYLSKMKQKWPGLILPIVTGVNATFIAFITLINSLANNLFRIFLLTIFLYLPTVVFIFIYKKVHLDNIQNQEINRMTIQDLD